MRQWRDQKENLAIQNDKSQSYRVAKRAYCQFPEIEQELVQLLKDQRRDEHCVDGQAIRKKTTQLHRDSVHIDNPFVASCGWLRRFFKKKQFCCSKNNNQWS